MFVDKLQISVAICFVFVRNDSASEMVVGCLGWFFGVFCGDFFLEGNESFLKSPVTSVMFSSVYEKLYTVSAKWCVGCGVF